MSFALTTPIVAGALSSITGLSNVNRVPVVAAANSLKESTLSFVDDVLSTVSGFLGVGSGAEQQGSEVFGVDGDAYINGAGYFGGQIDTTGSIVSAQTGAILTANSTTTSFKYIQIQNNPAVGDFILGVESSASGGLFAGSEAYDNVFFSNGKLYFYGSTLKYSVAAGEAFRVNSSRQVLIGTTTPITTGDKCSINGQLTATSLYLTSLPTSDPVSAGALWNNGGVVNISAG